MFKDKKFRVDERLIPQACHRATVDDISWIDGKLCVCGTQIKDMPQVLKKIYGSVPAVSMFFTRANHSWLLIASGEAAVGNLRRKMAPIRNFNELITMKHRWKPIVKTAGAKGAQPIPNEGIGAVLDTLSAAAGLQTMARTAARQHSFMVMDLAAEAGWNADIATVAKALAGHIAAGRAWFEKETGAESIFSSARLYTAADLKLDDGDLFCGGSAVTAAAEIMNCSELLGAEPGDDHRYWFVKAGDKVMLVLFKNAEEAEIIPESRRRNCNLSEIEDFEGGLNLFTVLLLADACRTAEPTDVQTESAKTVEAHIRALAKVWFDRAEQTAKVFHDSISPAA